MKTENSLFVIEPYWKSGTWVFDDANVNLVAEPFVMGIPEIINKMIEAAGLDRDECEDGFKLIFSHEKFPGAHVELILDRPDCGGNWYKTKNFGGMEGWLCPALFKYFPVAPPKLYGRVEALTKRTTAKGR